MLLLMGFASAYVLALDASQMMIWDEAEYASLGRSLANDGAFTITGDANYYRLPVVPMSSAVAQSAFGDRSNFVARLPTPIFAIACLAWIYFVVARVYDGWSALLAVCLLGSFPAFAESTGRLMTEIPFMFFNTDSASTRSFDVLMLPACITGITGIYLEHHVVSSSWASTMTITADTQMARVPRLSHKLRMHIQSKRERERESDRYVCLCLCQCLCLCLCLCLWLYLYLYLILYH